MIGARRHGELLAPMIRDVLVEAGAAVGDVSDVAVGVGPGPFTSLRVGIVTARAFALPRSASRCTGSARSTRWPTKSWPTAGGRALSPSASSSRPMRSDARSTGRPTARPVLASPVRPSTGPPRWRRVRAGRPLVGEGALVYPELLGGPIGPVFPRAGAVAEVAVDVLRAGAVATCRAVVPASPGRGRALGAQAGAAMTDTVLRPMRWWDVADVMPLERALFPADPWTGAGFWSELAGVPGTRTYLVAEADGELVGYAGLFFAGRLRRRPDDRCAQRPSRPWPRGDPAAGPDGRSRTPRRQHPPARGPRRERRGTRALRTARVRATGAAARLLRAGRRMPSSCGGG